MTINELERLTGITKQNIRFYEKKELLHPMRNTANNYREYTEEDLTALKTIKLLRKLDFSLEDIHSILSGETLLSTALMEQMDILQMRQQELNACIDMCKNLLGTELHALDIDKTLNKMNAIEQNGGKFMSIIHDYKRYAAAQHQKHFSFKPDTMVMNGAEFTDALTAYAKENDLNLVITKGGMSPIFEIDGVEYTAERIFDRFGATVHCTMTHPEDSDLDDIPERRKRIYRFLRSPYLFLLLLFIVMAIIRQSIKWTLLVAIMLFPYLCWVYLGGSDLRFTWNPSYNTEPPKHASTNRADSEKVKENGKEE